MLLRSFAALLITGGVLFIGFQNQNKLSSSENISKIKIEEYVFDPIYINVPIYDVDAGLD